MIILIYILALLSLSFFSYGFVDYKFPLQIPLFLHHLTSLSRPLTTAIYITITAFLFGGYLGILQQIKKRRINEGQIKWLIVIAVGILFFSFPAFSYDIFNYMATAKVTFFYRENPYLIMPIEFLGEPMLRFMHAANKTALYGPTWILLTAIPHFAGFGNLVLTVFTFKAFVTVFYLMVVWLVWKLSDKNLLSVAFFAFNPLVIIETLVSTHNDIVMMGFVLLSFFWLQQKKVLRATFIFLLSLLVKYSTIPLVPVFFYGLWKTIKGEKLDWQKIFIVSAAMMALTIIIFAPLREEIYPWYAIWVLTFVSLTAGRKMLLALSSVFSFSLLLRYVPFMLLGTHFGPTPMLKALLTFLPPTLFIFYKALVRVKKQFR